MVVGSTRIDTEFAILAQEHLQSHGLSKRDAEDLASTMMDGEEFQNNKRSFGDPDSPSPSEYKLRIPELDLELNFSRNDAANTFRFEVNS